MSYPVPAFPRIIARLESDATGTVTVNGVLHSVTGDTPEQARREVLRIATDSAVEMERAVRMTTTSDEGTFVLAVHPDGHVEALEETSTDTGDDTAFLTPLPHVEDPLPERRVRPLQDMPSTRRTARAEDNLPTLNDLLQSRPAAPIGPATRGWQGAIRRLTGGTVKLAPGLQELSHRSAVERVQQSLKGPRTVVVINPKGGAHKTTATLLLAATFGTHRGGSTLAWDNNETRGTLGWRAQPARHQNTAVDLLQDLDRFNDVRNSRMGDLDNYVRSQGSTQFDVLASDEDAAASSTIDATAFNELHHTLSRFYRVIVVDTGNNMRASNWEAALDAADQLVIVSTIREDTAASAAWLVDGLREKGHEQKVRNAVTILAAPSKLPDAQLNRRLHGHFNSLTRRVLDVPHDPALVDGGTLNFDALTPATREAWLQATAAVADGL